MDVLEGVAEVRRATEGPRVHVAAEDEELSLIPISEPTRPY